MPDGLFIAIVLLGWLVAFVLIGWDRARETDVTIALLAPPTSSLDATADRHHAYEEEGQ